MAARARCQAAIARAAFAVFARDIVDGVSCDNSFHGLVIPRVLRGNIFSNVG